MCRLVIYKGTEPVSLHLLIYRPKHSIINQAFRSLLRVDLRNPVNADGFGVGWYDARDDADAGSQPCIFTSVVPVWNDTNLIRLSKKIKSPLVFAHVRATTAGGVSLDNCHPFVYGKLMWMHNGNIASFPTIKRRLQSFIPDELFNVVSGNTEWAFALFLSKLREPGGETFKPEELERAMVETVAALNQFAREYDITEPSLLNFCVSDGETVIAIRYVSSKVDEAASLWFSSGTSFSEQDESGLFRMSKADKRENIIMVASEPLTFESADWMEIRTNTMVIITPKMNILQKPIIDEFYVHPSDPAAFNRTTSLAAGKGLLNPR